MTRWLQLGPDTSVTVGPTWVDKATHDFKNVADEILANLREDGTRLVVKIEIEATRPAGFDEGRVRTVSENARTLKFDQSGFEEN